MKLFEVHEHVLLLAVHMDGGAQPVLLQRLVEVHVLTFAHGAAAAGGGARPGPAGAAAACCAAAAHGATAGRRQPIV